jgi:mitofusin
MAQSYAPTNIRTSSTPSSPVKETAFPSLAGQEAEDSTVQRVSAAEDVQSAYLDNKDRSVSFSRYRDGTDFLMFRYSLVTAIDSTRSILNGLRQFNKESWIVRYPYLSSNPAEAEKPSSTTSLRRTLSFADDISKSTDVVISAPRPGMQRSVTLASVSESEAEGEQIKPEAEDTDRLVLPSSATDFHVLRLDLKLGPTGSVTSPGGLVSHLEKASIANLLDERIAHSIKHIDKLRARVEDTSSKVLVTGDLNSGKSTFVNALLHREIMPVDQQPCTTLFCEAHGPAENGGKEEAHIVKNGATYDIKDESTYDRVALDDLESVVSESDAQHIVKIYVSDARSSSESLLHNGIVDISLIDAPGLNRDSLKTTALFARQEEIDVVVFVVSAENHFTLSGKEFLWNASNEKAYLFIVVNRFDQIRDKARCKRLVLEQIKQLSPRTYEDAEDLVHFVDSSSALAKGLANDTSLTPSATAFEKLESSLRSFVLVKRAKSKLMPASTYLTNLLSDVDLLSSANAIVAESEIEQAKKDLDRARPVFESMKKGRQGLEDGLENEEEGTSAVTADKARVRLEKALENVGKGEIAVVSSDLAVSSKPRSIPSLPPYPGILGIWDYAHDVRQALLASLDLAVKLAEDDARIVTSAGVVRIADLGEKHLPAGVERSKRVFMPAAMFSPRQRGKKGNAVVAGGVSGLGIGLAQRPDLLEVSFYDVFDIQHYFAVNFGLGSDSKELESGEESGTSALSVISLGVGAVTMVGGKAIGARGLLEGLVRIGDLFGNPSSRKWAAPIVGAVTVGLTIYFILELPNTIPRTVGRQLKSTLTNPSSSTPSSSLITTVAEPPFVAGHSQRIARETRKVLRLASWDLRERFRGAMEESGKEVKNAEEMEKRARKALEWFIEVQNKTEEIRVKAELGAEISV